MQQTFVWMFTTENDGRGGGGGFYQITLISLKGRYNFLFKIE